MLWIAEGPGPQSRNVPSSLETLRSVEISVHRLRIVSPGSGICSVYSSIDTPPAVPIALGRPSDRVWGFSTRSSFWILSSRRGSFRRPSSVLPKRSMHSSADSRIRSATYWMDVLVTLWNALLTVRREIKRVFGILAGSSQASSSLRRSTDKGLYTTFTHRQPQFGSAPKGPGAGQAFESRPARTLVRPQV